MTRAWGVVLAGRDRYRAVAEPFGPELICIAGGGKLHAQRLAAEWTREARELRLEAGIARRAERAARRLRRLAALEARRGSGDGRGQGGPETAAHGLDRGPEGPKTGEVLP